MNQSLRNIYKEHNGRLLHKWDHYIEIYEKYFSKYRGKQINILEIGISHGGSLQMWREYFGEQANIYAVDINPECKKFEENGVKIFIGSQEDEMFLQKLFDTLPALDILIDDGGHTMKQQIYTFNKLFEKVKPDGVYLVEDTHTSYWKHWGGGFERKDSFIEFSKKFIDKLHAWHIDDSKVLAVDGYTKSINCVTFYDSIVVFEKQRREEPFHTMKGIPSIAEEIKPIKEISPFKKWKRALFPKKQNSFDRQLER